MAQGSRTYTLTSFDFEITIKSDAVGTIHVWGLSAEAAAALSSTGGLNAAFAGFLTSVIATDLSVTYRANDLAEASVSLGYTSAAGLALLQKIFPKTDEGAFFGELTIKVTGRGRFSYAPIKDRKITLFHGLIVGFSHRKGSDAISFVVNAYSLIYPLTQIPVATPGFHPTSGMNLGVGNAIAASSFAGTPTSARETASAVLNSLQGVRTVYELVKGLITNLLEQWDPDFKDLPQMPLAYRKAFADYGLKLTRQFVQAGVTDNIVASAGGTNAVIDSHKSAALLDVVQSVWSSSSLTFWALILSIIDKYGIDIICAGDGKGQLSVFNPLGYPVAGNIIQPEHQAVVDIRDFPFDSPTRVIITAPLSETYHGEGTEQPWRGVYPTTEDQILPQERKTGMKTVVIEAPSYLVATADLAAQEVAKRGTIETLRAGAKTGEEQLKLIRALNIKRRSDTVSNSSFFNDYARYMLIKQRFRQRTGMSVMRFDPSVLPGFVAQLVDPLGISGSPITNVFGYVQEVTHTLSSQAPSAQTSFSMSYVHYAGEVPAALTANPMYPGHNPGDDARKILVSMGVLTQAEAVSQAAKEAEAVAARVASAASAVAASKVSGTALGTQAQAAAASASAIAFNLGF